MDTTSDTKAPEAPDTAKAPRKPKAPDFSEQMAVQPAGTIDPDGNWRPG